MKTSRFFVSALFVLILTLSSAAAASRWIHVRVTEEEKGENVKVNLPVSLIQAVAPILRSKGIGTDEIELGSDKITIEELRAIWTAVKESGDYEMVSVDTPEARVRVSKEGNEIFVRSTEDSDTEVLVRVPVEVVDAVLSGSGDQLNVSAGLEAVAALALGDLVTVRDGGTHVRVWIDESNAGE